MNTSLPLPLWPQSIDKYLCSALSLLTLFVIRSASRIKSLMMSACEETNLALKVRRAKDVRAICELHGYGLEDHQVTTDDGYVLTLQRILPRDRTTTQKRHPVYLQHGLLTSSELFMRACSPDRCIPLVLVDNGYDVWLGNNRGNRYSQKHITKATNSPEFWDFSLDEFARHDIPNSINYVLSTTGASKASYIGFSQGTAQAFAALSLQPNLNASLDIFIALAPIMSPPGYASSILESNFKSNPDTYYRIFGRKSLFPSVRTWQSIIPIYLLRHVVEVALSFLFGWCCHNIQHPQRLAAYPHIYCNSSVKAVVHWSQIMRHASFASFQRDPGSEPERYPTENISVPMTLLYGEKDTLFELEKMKEHLPEHTKFQQLDNYEHIDVLWGSDVGKDVIPDILHALETRQT